MTHLQRKTFMRFKWAEEFAHDLDRSFPDTVPGWRLQREEDETYEEDGETYTRPNYVVEWWVLDAD